MVSKKKVTANFMEEDSPKERKAREGRIKARLNKPSTFNGKVHNETEQKTYSKGDSVNGGKIKFKSSNRSRIENSDTGDKTFTTTKTKGTGTEGAKVTSKSFTLNKKGDVTSATKNGRTGYQANPDDKKEAELIYAEKARKRHQQKKKKSLLSMPDNEFESLKSPR